MITQLRTLDVKATSDSLIKPGELVDVVEVTPLTLTDRKIYNLLIENAKQDIAKPVEHAIDKEKLRFSRRGDERIDDSILRLMGSIAHIRTERGGEPATIRVQLLGRNIEHDRNDGKFYYTFDPVLREIIMDSHVFARLKVSVMLSFSSKYALAMYEMVAKRINLRKDHEIFTITSFRNLVGVPKGKLSTWHNFKTRALDPAIAELNQLATDFHVEAEGIKTGRSYTHVQLKWWRTAPDGEEAALNEHIYSKVGRKARREGTVETLNISDSSSYAPKLSHVLTDQALENARSILLAGRNRIGLQQAISMWDEAFTGKEPPANPNGAFIGFCKKIA
jgi:hypothetical protein